MLLKLKSMIIKCDLNLSTLWFLPPSMLIRIKVNMFLCLAIKVWCSCLLIESHDQNKLYNDEVNSSILSPNLLSSVVTSENVKLYSYGDPRKKA